MTGRARGIGLHKQNVDSSLDTIDGALREIEAEIETLQRKVTKLESQWDGDAREAFSVAMRECRETLVEMHRVGAGLNRVARTSVTRFDEFDRRRSSAWAL